MTEPALPDGISLTMAIQAACRTHGLHGIPQRSDRYTTYTDLAAAWDTIDLKLLRGGATCRPPTVLEVEGAANALATSKADQDADRRFVDWQLLKDMRDGRAWGATHRELIVRVLLLLARRLGVLP